MDVSDIPAGDCDCNGNQEDALGVCGGDCAADADMDGICDDVDDCVGSLMLVPATARERSTSADALTSQPATAIATAPADALGVCGGDRAADANATAFVTTRKWLAVRMQQLATTTLQPHKMTVLVTTALAAVEEEPA